MTTNPAGISENRTAVAGSLAIGEAIEDWTGDARFFEYSQAADPIGSGAITPVPAVTFSPDLHAGGPSRIVPLDLSAQLGTPYPATSPALLASFVRIVAGDEIRMRPNATSQLMYCLSGRGASRSVDGTMAWQQGDFITLPAGGEVSHMAERDATLYHVADSPLLDYLGAVASTPRFAERASRPPPLGPSWPRWRPRRTLRTGAGCRCCSTTPASTRP